MTISSTTRKAGPYSGTGAQTAFPFAFKVFATSDVLVVQTDSTGAETRLTTGYSVVLNPDQDASPGGTVNLLTSPPVGALVTIGSVVPVTQGQSIPNQGGFYPKVIERALDKLTVIIQQLAGLADRSLKFPFSDTVTADLPTAVQRANNLLGFDSNGNPVAVVPSAQSAAALQVLLAASGGAALLGWIQSGIGAIKRTIQDKLRDTISVKDFGATGDGVTDDTAALNLAAAALPNNKALYFPAGTYIVDAGCVVFRDKANICVYGDGAATIIRPSAQGVAPVKQDYHTSVAFDLCTGVTVRDMVIEGKGESYGNIDAYSPPLPDDRANAIINYGGSALLVSRCDHVTLVNLIARRCGSCGVVYLSSCEEVVVVNCFANARSLGYAGFAVDNWVHSTLKPKRTYKFVNCRVSKEDAAYAAKAGIASEGDEVTGRLINMDVVGGCFEDCYTGANVLWQGAGISCMETRLTMNGVNTKNCYIGLTWIKRGGAVDKSWCRVTGGAFDSCGVAGAYIAISTATGGADVSLIGTRIDVQPGSAWSGQADNSVKYSSGITVPGFSSGEINIDGCRISGGQYGLWAIDTANFNVIGSEIFGSIAAIRTYGGGNLKVVGGRLAVTAGDRVIGRDTANLAATASSTLNTHVVGALLETVGNTAADYLISLAGNGALFASTIIKGNAAPRGVYNALRGAAAPYDVDIFDSAGTWTPVVGGSVSPGTYEINAGSTRATYTRKGNLVTLNGYIQIAGAITGGGTGDLQITGLPFAKRVDTSAFGAGVLSGVDFSATAMINAYFGTLQASSSLYFWQTIDNSGVTLVPISGVSAGDIIAFSLAYEA